MEINHYLQIYLLLAMMDFVPQLLVIVAHRMKKQNNKSIIEVLVQWTETNPEDAVWKNLTEMQQKFPDFQWVGVRPCCKVLVDGRYLLYNSFKTKLVIRFGYVFKQNNYVVSKRVFITPSRGALNK